MSAVYSKIPALYKRDGDNPRSVLVGIYKDRHVEALANYPVWTVTEKLDGANTRLHWNGTEVRVGSRRTWQHQANIVDAIEAAHPHLEAMFEQNFEGDDVDVTVYGEAIGAGVQKGGAYGDKIRFVAFDVTVGGRYLKNRDARDVVWQLGLDFVEARGRLVSVTDVWAEMSGGGDLPYSTYRERQPEGYVLRTVPEMYKANGDRIMVKLTYRDLGQLVQP